MAFTRILQASGIRFKQYHADVGHYLMKDPISSSLISGFSQEQRLSSCPQNSVYILCRSPTFVFYKLPVRGLLLESKLAQVT